MFAKLAIAAALVLSFALGTAARAADGPITDPAAKKVEAFHTALLDVMKRGGQLGMQGRYKALEPAADTAFDFPTMTQFVVGPTWANMSDADHKSLIAAFRRLTLANYASNFDSYNGQKFTSDPNVLQHGNDKIVQTVLVLVGDKPVPLLYRMRPAGDSWKIIDIFLEGYVSELATRRSDFASTVSSGGAAGLLKKMTDLGDNLLSGAKRPAP